MKAEVRTLKAEVLSVNTSKSHKQLSDAVGNAVRTDGRVRDGDRSRDELAKTLDAARKTFKDGKSVLKTFTDAKATLDAKVKACLTRSPSRPRPMPRPPTRKPPLMHSPSLPLHPAIQVAAIPTTGVVAAILPLAVMVATLVVILSGVVLLMALLQPVLALVLDVPPLEISIWAD